VEQIENLLPLVSAIIIYVSQTRKQDVEKIIKNPKNRSYIYMLNSFITNTSRQFTG
jgi:hypothetical protein